MDIDECETMYRLFLDMSGAAQEALTVTLDGHILRIEARAGLSLEPECRPLQVEFITDYLREIALGQSINPEKIQARLNDGVLELLLPKSKPAAKKIAVEAIARPAR